MYNQVRVCSERATSPRPRPRPLGSPPCSHATTPPPPHPHHLMRAWPQSGRSAAPTRTPPERRRTAHIALGWGGEHRLLAVGPFRR
eukprot:7318021-Prymnesium_polylepis.1